MGTVVITGCSTGFGLLSALSFARRGDRVFATMRNTAKAGALKESAAAENLAVDIVELDVTDDDSVARGVDAVLEQAGTIDVLVNNAGIAVGGAIELVSDADARSMFETNVFGALRMSKACLPAMRAQQSGSIVNVSSLAGRMAAPFNGIYAATKHALCAISEAMRLEVEPFGVRVVSVEPGFFRTEIGRTADQNTTLDSSSPYGAREAAAVRNNIESVDLGGDPQIVADLIVEAAYSADDNLHYVTPPEGIAMVQAKATMSDAQWFATVRSTLLDRVASEL